MIFPKLTIESVVQVEDKTRLNASLTFSADGEEITCLKIRPEGASQFVDVFNSGNNRKWFLDWAYDSVGTKTITVKVTTALGDTSKDYELEVITKSSDSLFSSDSDLYPFEPKITEYLPEGKNSFIYAHRAAQEKIIAYLDEQKIWKADGSTYTKEDIAAISDNEIRTQFRRWSIHQTFVIIYESLQVGVNDIFQEKKIEHYTLAKGARKRAALRLDQDGDGSIDDSKLDIKTIRMIRR